MSLMSGMTVYMVGKGPSLDRISREDFPDPAAPVMCMNDATMKINSLELPNPVYSVQNSIFREDECVPSGGIVFVTERFHHTIKRAPLKATFNPEALGYPRQVPGVVFGIKIAQHFGAARIIFLCFDSCMSGTKEYANCLSEQHKAMNFAGGAAAGDALRTHKGRIKEAAGETPYEFREVTKKVGRRQEES